MSSPARPPVSPRAAPERPPAPRAVEVVFSPVRSQTAFEETVERIGTAIRLGLLAPGDRLPAERDLSQRLGVARSTLRHALTALVQSGHLVATRGRGGGTFVATALPPPDPPPAPVLAGWRETCDRRLAVELGVVVLAAERVRPDQLAELERLATVMEGAVDDFRVYRQTDVRFHVTLAEAAASPSLIAAATEAQGEMTGLISLIAHPPEVLSAANALHRRLLAALRARDEAGAVRVMTMHLRGTEHVLAGLLPAPSGA